MHTSSVAASHAPSLHLHLLLHLSLFVSVLLLSVIFHTNLPLTSSLNYATLPPPLLTSSSKYHLDFSLFLKLTRVSRFGSESSTRESSIKYSSVSCFTTTKVGSQHVSLIGEVKKTGTTSSYDAIHNSRMHTGLTTR